MPVKPAFMIHTGDISHLSKVSEFDNADRIISQTRLDVHYVPGEHDVIDENTGEVLLSCNEELTEAEVSRIVPDRNPPADRIRQAGDDLERDCGHQAPSD